MFDDEYKAEFVGIIKDHITKTPYNEKELSTWKRYVEMSGGKLGRSAYEDIKTEQEALKEYTLAEIKKEDFIFTDFVDISGKKRGIHGPEEVKRRITEYLTQNNIQGTTYV